MGKTYTCAACGGVFESDWSDEDAAMEAKTLWGDMPADEMVVICDDCFHRGRDDALREHHADKVQN